MNMLCDICADTFNKSNRKELICIECNKSCCIACFESYITSSVNDADCMFCHKVFDRDFFVKNTSSALQGRYKTHREQILLDREKAKLPETMEKYYEYYITIQKFIQEVIEIRKRKMIIRNKRYEIRKIQNKTKQEMYENQTLKSESFHLSTILYPKERVISKWYSSFEKVLLENKEEKIKQNKIMCQCPLDTCKGFVYTTGKCGVCDTKVCTKCRCIDNEENHECLESDIETVKLLKADSKACPKCATFIFKISGCNQMWCTQCHTAFDWKTGLEVTSNIHNPHYFHWINKGQNNQNNQNNQENMNPCGGDIQYNQLVTHSKIVCKHREDLFVIIVEMYRTRLHIIHVNIVDIRANIHDNPETENLNLRLKWLNNEITESKWKFELQKREKAKVVNTSKIQIFEMVSTVLNDINHKILHINDIDGIEEIMKEFFNLLEYANNSFETLSKAYKIKTTIFYFYTEQSRIEIK